MQVTLPKPLRSRPLVSVVVPCYNYGHYLPQAVDSILSQQGVDLEVIIVDDQSTDGSELVAAELAAGNPCVRVIRNEVNKRHIATYNTGLAEITGDYVVLLSADDMLAEGALARATALMEQYPSVGLVYGYCPDFTDVPEPSNPARTWSVWNGIDWLRAVAHRGDNVVINPEVVMRASVMKDLVGYDPAFPHAADLLLWLQSAAISDIGRVNGVQAYYRTHAKQMHVTDYAGTLTDMRERAALYRAFFTDEGRGAQLPGAHRMLRNALRATAKEAVWCAVLARIADDTVGGSDSDAFREFALANYPKIRQTILWRDLERRRTGRTPIIPDRQLRFAYRAKWAVKWRIWRRWGL
ncbi:glycosyltransferase [Microlunatus sp. Gsoil 973]|nr:glycosyltransferase [Microlunatus sp. Gsoil 973]